MDAAAARQGEELSHTPDFVQLKQSPGRTLPSENRSQPHVDETDTGNKAIPTLPPQPNPASSPESGDSFAAAALATATRQSPEAEGDSNSAKRQSLESERDSNGAKRQSQEGKGDSNGATRQSLESERDSTNSVTRQSQEGEGCSNGATRQSPEGEGASTNGATRPSLNGEGDLNGAKRQSLEREGDSYGATRQSPEGEGDSNGVARQSLEGDGDANGATEAEGDGLSRSTTPSTKFPQRLPVAGTKQRIQVVVRIRPVDELPSRYDTYSSVTGHLRASTSYLV